MIKQQITRRKLRALQVNSVQLFKEHHAHSHIMEFQVSCPSLSQLSQVRTGARSFAWSTRGQVMALNVWGVRCFLTTGVYVDFRILFWRLPKRWDVPGFRRVDVHNSFELVCVESGGQRTEPQKHPFPAFSLRIAPSKGHWIWNSSSSGFPSIWRLEMQVLKWFNDGCQEEKWLME